MNFMNKGCFQIKNGKRHYQNKSWKESIDNTGDFITRRFRPVDIL